MATTIIQIKTQDRDTTELWGYSEDAKEACRTKDVEANEYHAKDDAGTRKKFKSVREYDPIPVPTHQGDEYCKALNRGCRISVTAGASQSPSASCPSHMSRGGEKHENGSWTRQASRTGEFSTRGTRKFSDAAWDTDVLRGYYSHRQNIVLDSVNPALSPHIVISPAEETWNDQLTAWENRVDMQWPCNLMVPLNAHGIWPPTQCLRSNPVVGLDHPPVPSTLHKAKAVFSISKYIQYVRSTSVERLVMCELVKTLHRQQCRATFFAAGITALRFRTRYDNSLDSFVLIDKPFAWSDPAESILAANDKLLGTTIIHSSCPFLVPHIIINAPPPQDFWIRWNNATNDPQDHGYGQYLIVPSNSVEIINAAEDWDAASHFDSTLEQSDNFSRPSTPMPETPVDDDDDLHFFFTRYGDGDDSTMEVGFNYSSVPEVLPAPDTCFPNNLPSSRPIFTIEEDEDDLPPFDDWYQ